MAVKLATDYITAQGIYAPRGHVQTVTSPWKVRDCARCSDGTTSGMSFSTRDEGRTLCNGCEGKQ